MPGVKNGAGKSGTVSLVFIFCAYFMCQARSFFRFLKSCLTLWKKKVFSLPLFFYLGFELHLLLCLTHTAWQPGASNLPSLVYHLVCPLLDIHIRSLRLRLKRYNRITCLTAFLPIRASARGALQKRPK